MDAPNDSPPPHRSGWLSKEGKRLKARSRRYLLLKDYKLSHHVKETSPPTWQLPLNDIRVTIGDRPLQFIISAGGRSVAFFADDSEDYRAWVRALKSTQSTVEDFYTLGKQLGKGSYGEVFLATDRLTHAQVAVKIIRKNPVNRKQKKFLQREQAIMTTVDHENIVKTIEIFDIPSKLAIVSEYMKGGELFDLIITSQYFTEEKARHISRQILEGVRYLHSRNIVHRDIKPENVLCASKTWPLNVKLTDFGLSNFLGDGHGQNDAMLLSHVGTSYYIAPEIVGKGGYGPAVDIWASGVVLYIMLCGRFPFWGKTDIEYMKSLSRGPCMVGEGWDEVSEEGKQFLRQMLQVDPKKRLTAEKALSHPWVSRDAPSLDRRLSSISGLAAIASKNKLRVNPGQKSSKGRSDTQSDGPNSTNETVSYID
ncbi:unnamed protein product [Agarophyton chilense]